MIKMMALGKKNGRPIKVVVFGLSHRNLDLLREGRPIIIEGKDFNTPDMEVCIFAGTDEETMQKDLAQFIGPETEVRVSPRFKESKT